MRTYDGAPNGANTNATEPIRPAPFDLTKATPGELLHLLLTGADGDPVAEGLRALAADLDVLGEAAEETWMKEALHRLHVRARVLAELSRRERSGGEGNARGEREEARRG